MHNSEAAVDVDDGISVDDSFADLTPPLEAQSERPRSAAAVKTAGSLAKSLTADERRVATSVLLSLDPPARGAEGLRRLLGELHVECPPDECDALASALGIRDPMRCVSISDLLDALAVLKDMHIHTHTRAAAERGALPEAIEEAVELWRRQKAAKKRLRRASRAALRHVESRRASAVSATMAISSRRGTVAGGGDVAVLPATGATGAQSVASSSSSSDSDDSDNDENDEDDGMILYTLDKRGVPSAEGGDAVANPDNTEIGPSRASSPSPVAPASPTLQQSLSQQSSVVVTQNPRGVSFNFSLAPVNQPPPLQVKSTTEISSALVESGGQAASAATIEKQSALDRAREALQRHREESARTDAERRPHIHPKVLNRMLQRQFGLNLLGPEEAESFEREVVAALNRGESIPGMGFLTRGNSLRRMGSIASTASSSAGGNGGGESGSNVGLTAGDGKGGAVRHKQLIDAIIARSRAGSTATSSAEAAQRAKHLARMVLDSDGEAYAELFTQNYDLLDVQTLFEVLCAPIEPGSPRSPSHSKSKRRSRRSTGGTSSGVGESGSDDDDTSSDDGESDVARSHRGSKSTRERSSTASSGTRVRLQFVDADGFDTLAFLNDSANPMLRPLRNTISQMHGSGRSVSLTRAMSMTVKALGTATAGAAKAPSVVSRARTSDEMSEVMTVYSRAGGGGAKSVISSASHYQRAGRGTSGAGDETASNATNARHLRQYPSLKKKLLFATSSATSGDDQRDRIELAVSASADTEDARMQDTNDVRESRRFSKHVSNLTLDKLQELNDYERRQLGVQQLAQQIYDERVAEKRRRERYLERQKKQIAQAVFGTATTPSTHTVHTRPELHKMEQAIFETMAPEDRAKFGGMAYRPHLYIRHGNADIYRATQRAQSATPTTASTTTTTTAKRRPPLRYNPMLSSADHQQALQRMLEREGGGTAATADRGGGGDTHSSTGGRDGGGDTSVKSAQVLSKFDVSGIDDRTFQRMLAGDITSNAVSDSVEAPRRSLRLREIAKLAFAKMDEATRPKHKYLNQPMRKNVLKL